MECPTREGWAEDSNQERHGGPPATHKDAGTGSKNLIENDFNDWILIISSAGNSTPENILKADEIFRINPHQQYRSLLDYAKNVQIENIS